MKRNLKYKKYLIMLRIKEMIIKEMRIGIIDRVIMGSSLVIYQILMRHNLYMKISKL